MNSDLPLSHKRVVVTRSEDQSDLLVAELQRFGADVISVPTIRIEPAALSSEDTRRLSEFHRYDVVIFTSVNAVRHAGAFSGMRKTDGRPFVMAVGTKTADALTESGLQADFVPEKFTSADLISSLGSFDWKGKIVLVPKGSLSGSDLAESVRSLGGVVEEVVVYQTLPNNAIERNIKEKIFSGEFDAVVFYSPSQLKNFLNIFGKAVLDGKEIAVIGPVTRKAAEKFGLSVDVVPENSTTESLVASMVGHEKA